MIKFKIRAEAAWVSGDDPCFDETELGEYSKKERANIEFLINPFTSEIVDRLKEKHTSYKHETSFEGGRRVSQRVEKTDDVAFRNEAIDEIVADWRGIIDEDEKKLDCTQENKLKLIDRGYPRLGGAWIDVARKIMSNFDKFQKQKKGKEIKNLPSSQGGLCEEKKK